MNLEEYLLRIELCKDPDRLQTDFKIYDNYSISLKIDYQEFLKDLNEHKHLQRKFQLRESSKEEDGVESGWYDYIHGTLTVGIRNFGLFPFSNSIEDRRTPKKENGIIITIHDGWQEKKVQDTDYKVVMAEVVIDLIKYSKDKGIKPYLGRKGICFSITEN